jgi:hypothetical protein
VGQKSLGLVGVLLENVTRVSARFALMTILSSLNRNGSSEPR